MSQDGIPPAVRRVYGPEDLSTAAPFAGGYINFGDWSGVAPAGPPTRADRVRSQQALYRRVLGEFPRPGAGRLAEVGCGRGLGCALAVEELGFAAVTGVDIHPEQVARATAANAGPLAAHPDRLAYTTGAADRLPFEAGTLDGVYSVEAAQHFPELPGFAREAARVLRPGGRLVVTTFFTSGPAAAGPLRELLESFADGLDVPHPIDGFAEALDAAGFARPAVRSIGPAVWPGFDRFLAGGVVPPGHWSRNFLPAWRDGLLDYYLVTADRPGTP
ncbi:methyltransferase domain-containing protein [Kitasatospora sp. NBC_00240]|uniref:methyltransferase domain-containing protein n=1 Tax=Kitasatospora sp. NBC_00240 TaxID=2903567 RepID=UPI0022531EEC|nr:class I SAM-dependent methyltransferase [Kitasatospora sp. NBC_00240]MCX5208916.1 methyltransferase domain-containing protein [Kitasatospora sp. NBC_00240]